MTIGEVMIHIKNENGVGSEKYKNVFTYLEKFTDIDLLYLEIECKAKIEGRRIPVGWNYIAVTMSLLSAFISLIVANSIILEKIIGDFVIRFAVLTIIFVICFCVLQIYEGYKYINSIKYMKILEIIYKIQEKKRNFSVGN